MQIVKPQYSYAFANLAARDQVVFNSIVGLLFGRTQAQWSPVGEGNPDLLVQGTDTQLGSAFGGTYKAVLRVSQGTTLGAAMSIHWPLRANEVLASLDQAAQMLGTESLWPTPSRYQLLHWPAQQLLRQNLAHLRLATLLGTRAFTHTELSERSGESMQLCGRFIEQLLAVNAVCVETPKAVNEAMDVAPVLGFFARLRAHMGLPRTRVAS